MSKELIHIYPNLIGIREGDNLITQNGEVFPIDGRKVIVLAPTKQGETSSPFQSHVELSKYLLKRNVKLSLILQEYRRKAVEKEEKRKKRIRYAVMKEGSKRALRVFKLESEALSFIESKDDNLTMEVRK